MVCQFAHKTLSKTANKHISSQVFTEEVQIIVRGLSNNVDEATSRGFGQGKHKMRNERIFYGTLLHYCMQFLQFPAVKTPINDFSHNLRAKKELSNSTPKYWRLVSQYVSKQFPIFTCIRYGETSHVHLMNVQYFFTKSLFFPPFFTIYRFLREITVSLVANTSLWSPACP